MLPYSIATTTDEKPPSKTRSALFVAKLVHLVGMQCHEFSSGGDDTLEVLSFHVGIINCNGLLGLWVEIGDTMDSVYVRNDTCLACY